MLTEIALGTLGYMGYDALRRHWGLWLLTKSWEQAGLKNRLEQTPRIIENQPTKYGRRVVVGLPAGVAMDDFLRKVTHMEEQTRATIQVTTKHCIAMMDIIKTPLPEDVAYRIAEKSKMRLPVGIGATGKGNEVLIIDLSKLPHLFNAGNTGGGKSTFLHGLIVVVLASGAVVCVIDLKRVEYHYLHKHATIADTEPMAYALLEQINAEMDRRLAVLKKHDLVHKKDYKGNDMPWLVLVIDELAELTDKDAQEMLNRICRLSRAAGICVVATTQRPSHTLYKNFTDTRSLFAGRLCFSVPSPEDSRMVLGDDSAYRLPRNVPGRAIFQWNGTHTVQCMNLSPSQAREIIAEIPPRKAAFNLDQFTEVLQP